MSNHKNTFRDDTNAVSEVIGEVLMTAIAVLAFSVIAVFVFSYVGADERVHVNIGGWVDVDSDTIYIRHTGGEQVDLNKVQVILNLNGTRQDISPSQLVQLFGDDSWYLGETIMIETDALWNTSINEDDYVGIILLQTGSNIVIKSGSLLGDEIALGAGSESNGSGNGGPQAPSANFTYLPPDPVIYETVVFTDQSSDADGTIIAWSWNFGDGNTSTAQNPSHQYSSAGNYTVSLTVTDDDGNTDSSSRSVTVIGTQGTYADRILLNKPAKGGIIKDGGYVSFTNDGNYRYVDIDGVRYDLDQSDSITLEIVNDQTAGAISMDIGSSQISTFDLNVNLYINGNLEDTGQVTSIYIQPISNYYSTLRYELPSDNSQTYLEADGDIIINWETNDSAINISNIGFYSPGNTQINFGPTGTYLKCSGYYQLSSEGQSGNPETPLPIPVSLWSFDVRTDNIVVDSEGGNDGIISGADRVPSGVNNSAIEFEQGSGQGSGNKEYITVPHSSDLDLITEGSVEAWVYIQNYRNDAGIVHKGEQNDRSDESYSLRFGGLGNNKRILLSLNDGEFSVISNTELTSQSWYHVVATWNSTSLIMYINGNIDNIESGSGIASNPSSGSLQIGSQLPGSVYGLQGRLDEVVIYSYALDASEVQQRYDLYV
ncbi:LamG-like jellyroll fold domain-containing protein [Methanolobus sp.]|uniref:LamG-like jellyroll fold domain-containing protein n=1 Tax=Methanolobus sp. TaxID=1874737 RepID=UPI0025DB8326|nr:LamG-like jellyroll fold domain-containing protein [Methanolobus sp.]